MGWVTLSAIIFFGLLSNRTAFAVGCIYFWQWMLWSFGKSREEIEMVFLHCANPNAVRKAKEESRRGLPYHVNISFIPPPDPPADIRSEWRGVYPKAAIDWIHQCYRILGFTDTDAPPFRCLAYTPAANRLGRKPRLETMFRKKNEKAFARYQRKHSPPEDLGVPQAGGNKPIGRTGPAESKREEGLGKRFPNKVRIEFSGIGEERWVLWGPFWFPLVGGDGKIWLCDAPDLPVVMAGEADLDKFFSAAVVAHQEADPFYVRIVTTGHAVWIDVQVSRAGEVWVITDDGEISDSNESVKSLVRGLWEKYASVLEPTGKGEDV